MWEQIVINGFQIIYASIYFNIPIYSCADGYYDIHIPNCDICNTSCTTCVNISTNCLTCSSPNIKRVNNPPTCSCRGNRFGEFCICPIG